MQFWTAKADFRVRKQISECARRILECENRYRSAKALPTASRRIFFLPALRAGEFFSLKSQPDFFFAKSSCPPPQ